MATITVAGAPVWYGTGGAAWRSGRPLAVFVHGAGMDHTVWALAARSLARSGWNAAAPDLPGHGRSAPVAARSIGERAAWLAELLEKLAPEPVLLVGHSLGAAISLALAAEHPEQVRGLALLGAAARMPVNDALLEDARSDPARAHLFIAAFGHARGHLLGGSQSPGLWLLGSALALLERCPPEVLREDFAACNEWEGEIDAARVRAPTLVLSGDRDRMTPSRAGRALAELVPGARFEQIADAGHLLLSEAPDAVDRALRAFAATLPEPERSQPAARGR